MAAERHRQASFLAEREIEPLPDIVKGIEFDHHVMDRRLAGLDEGETVMARVNVQEARRIGLRVEIAQAEAEDIFVEVGDLVDALDMHDDVAEPERPGAETGDRAAGLERIGGDLAAMKNLDAVAERIAEHDQVLDVPLAGERARAARKRHACRFEASAERIERRTVGDFPAEELDARAAVVFDDHALLAVVHAKGNAGAAFVDKLKTQHARPVAAPIVEIGGVEADIAQRLRKHFAPLFEPRADCGGKSSINGGPERSRTSDLRFRKPLLYPAELRDRRGVI